MAWGILWRVYVTLVIYSIVISLCLMATPARWLLYDPQFAVWKLTIGNFSFACVLLASLACLDRGALALCFGKILAQDRSFWRRLTVWTATLYLVLAVVNLLIWKLVPFETWLRTKAFVSLGALIVFSIIIPRFLDTRKS